jgi:hypothetical protein
MAKGCGLLLPDHDHERNLFIHERRPVRKIEIVTPCVVEVTAIDDGAINLEQVMELSQRVANEACIVLTLRNRLVVPLEPDKPSGAVFAGRMPDRGCDADQAGAKRNRAKPVVVETGHCLAIAIMTRRFPCAGPRR